MTLDDAQKLCKEIREARRRYAPTHAEYREKEIDGEIKFVILTVEMKIDPNFSPKKPKNRHQDAL